MNKFLTFFISILFISSTFAQNETRKKITLDDVMRNYTFYPNSVYGIRSMNDGEHYTTLEDGRSIEKFDYKTGSNISQIFDINKFSGIKIKNISDYEFSESEEKLIVWGNKIPIYRRSFTADYYIYDTKTKKINPVSQNMPIQLATLSPNGKFVAFVRSNNIYITNLESGQETQITTDGEKNKIIYGAPDWVYEEEFEFNKALEWSVDSKSLAFMRFDENEVPEFGMTLFKGLAPALEQNKLYPEYRVWKYPKAGDSNSIVNVHIYNVENQKTIIANTGNETDQYIPRIQWTKNTEKLSVLRLNRLQNKLEILLADAKTGETNIIYTEINKYYIDETLFDYISFLSDGEQFTLVSEKDGFTHIYLYNLKGEEVKQITKGNFDVTNFYGYDEKNKVFYYQAAEKSSLQREIYSIKLNGKDKKNLSAKLGTNSADFSKTFKYFINEFSAANTPTIVSLNDANGKEIKVLENNSGLNELLKKYAYQEKTFFKFKTEQNVELNGWMVKPINFDATKKYPVLMTQYSGPNSQSATDDFQVGWEQVLANEGYIVVCVDGRGTAARGEEFRKMTYLQLGKYEIEDQIETAKYLGSLPYVKKENITIWGWSYGGFMALLGVTKGADYFSAAIAVAPVTNWRYYDNIYTERFMRTPQENPNGYDDNSPINHVQKFKGKLLLVHGTADDNVHWQNSAEFVEAMVQENKQFQTFYYTNRNHGIYGGKTRLHLYNMFLNFLKTNN